MDNLVCSVIVRAATVAAVARRGLVALSLSSMAVGSSGIGDCAAGWSLQLGRRGLHLS